MDNCVDWEIIFSFYVNRHHSALVVFIAVIRTYVMVLMNNDDAKEKRIPKNPVNDNVMWPFWNKL